MLSSSPEVHNKIIETIKSIKGYDAYHVTVEGASNVFNKFQLPGYPDSVDENDTIRFIANEIRIDDPLFAIKFCLPNNRWYYYSGADHIKVNKNKGTITSVIMKNKGETFTIEPCSSEK